jgi:hypothetical protein
MSDANALRRVALPCRFNDERSRANESSQCAARRNTDPARPDAARLELRIPIPTCTIARYPHPQSASLCTHRSLDHMPYATQLRDSCIAGPLAIDRRACRVRRPTHIVDHRMRRIHAHALTRSRASELYCAAAKREKGQTANRKTIRETMSSDEESDHHTSRIGVCVYVNYEYEVVRGSSWRARARTSAVGCVGT